MWQLVMKSRFFQMTSPEFYNTHRTQLNYFQHLHIIMELL